MEPGTKGQLFTSKELTFTGPRTLVSWLDSPRGAEIRKTLEERWLVTDLEGRLFDNSEESARLRALVIERADKTVRAVVTVQPMENGEVDVTVYGPHELRARIIRLPVIPENVEARAEIEKLIEVEL